eukprot:TRINITY_DN120_c0_g1_i5.p1 TRINITY_DN120_c0_g1~~TRINITY_DN120_c0_g1_i5.p1  ORF type:complete len:347 (+),score=179.67 TRINITY_DN120_c0_g1_i5:357-1397(+)
MIKSSGIRLIQGGKSGEETHLVGDEDPSVSASKRKRMASSPSRPTVSGPARTVPKTEPREVKEIEEEEEEDAHHQHHHLEDGPQVETELHEEDEEDVEDGATHTIIEGGEEVVEEGSPGSGGHKEVQYVVIDKSGSASDVSRGVLSRQPSYCKILKDLKEAEEDVVLKDGSGVGGSSETIEVTTSEAPVQTITINGQQYQIVSPASLSDSGTSSSVVQYAAAANSNGQTVFIPGTLSSPPSGGSGGEAPVSPPSSSSQVITVSSPSSHHHHHHNTSNSLNTSSSEDASRKREIRLLKNREAARECRNKKKEYIRCLENRVAVLENQNKALIEELKSLKELYTGQKN